MFKRIKILRLEANFSIEFISNYLDIPISIYTQIESGKHSIKTIHLIKLARLYNTSVDYLVNETDVRYKYEIK